MVRGLDAFRKHFKGYEGNYVLIGGTACDLLFREFELPFRATKDLDIVLIAEAITPAFGKRFWEFVKQGQYEIRQRSDGTPIFYRFQKPSDDAYPAMLELFSRNTDALSNADDRGVCAPIPIGEEISSLSAILLNEAYYGLLKGGTIQIDGVSLLAAEQFLLFKAKAWLDLSTRKASGEPVDRRDIKKHRDDVVRLTTILSPDKQIDIDDSIRDDIHEFVQALEQDDTLLKLHGVPDLLKEDVLARIKHCYQI